MSDQKWKQIVGKSISEGAYISSFELKESYAKVMKMTTISTNGNGKVSHLAEEVTKLTERIEKQNTRIEALEKERFLSKATFEMMARRFNMTSEELEHEIETEAQRHEGTQE